MGEHDKKMIIMGDRNPIPHYYLFFLNAKIVSIFFAFQRKICIETLSASSSFALLQTTKIKIRPTKKKNFVEVFFLN